MEAVKPKKPRPKERAPVRETPPVPSRPAVVMGMRLPEVPQHEPCRTSSPEPEEVVLSDDEQPSTSTVVTETVDVPHSDEVLSNGTAIESEKTHRTLLRDSADITHHGFPACSHNVQLENLMFGASFSTPIVEASSLPAQVAVFDPVCYPSIPQLSESTMNSTYTTTVAPPPLYEELSKGIMEKARIFIIQDTIQTSLSLDVNVFQSAAIAGPQVADAPPLYPSLTKTHYEKDCHGLLTEQNLLAFYHNPLYMMSEEFTDKFVENNLISSGPLFPLLKRLKKLCEQMAISEVSEKENTESLSKCLRDCWVMQQQTFESKGKCGENKEATGTGRFHKSVLCMEKVEELKNLLAANRTHLLDERICQESQFRATALQVQWVVISINQQFMEENGLSLQSPPTCEFPSLAKRFTDALTGWAKELICVLYMLCRCEDAQFVLNHLLRLPSPIVEWAAPFVQTFIQAPSPPKVKVDYCVTMLSHLMNPISARETFLRQIGLSESEDSTWAILSGDEEEGDFSLVTINEADLTGLLDQLPISELYSLAYLYFSSSTSDKSDQFVALIAFQLLLMKVLDTGLSTYCAPTYKTFCKQIGNCLRQSVRELCSHWTITRNLLRSGEDSQLQKEVDRIVLLAVQYLATRPGFGLWQFLVDLPYDCVSEECRNRCEYFLRSTEHVKVSEIYDIPISEVLARNKIGGVKERLEAIGPLDAVFLINTLAALSSYSHNDASHLVKEIIELNEMLKVCFCDETSRESLYKVGSEAVSLLIARRPSTFDQLLTLLDRSMTHMDNPPDDAANRMARRILSSLHWGPNEAGDQLWLDPAVHEISADTVMKVGVCHAHSIHCGHSNGMIAKSIRQISKLASRMADHEQLFNQFCWDILIKIKLNPKYAIDVLASSNLSGCKLSPSMLSILGKWLINKPPDDAANRMARRILSSLHWGPNEAGDQLWLDPAVHEISADTVMKVGVCHAHSIHCGHSNGMIAKSIRQISKLASRMADHEQLFNQFCWDILIKIKLNPKQNDVTPQNDLSAFFIYIDQSCLESPSVFLERGVPLMNDLVAAGCSTACVVLLARLMQKHYTKVISFGSHKAFMELFDRVLHVDQCSYAVQWITGPSSKPTPIVRLICSSLSYYSKHVHDTGQYLRAWINLLCVRRPTLWINDSVGNVASSWLHHAHGIHTRSRQSFRDSRHYSQSLSANTHFMARNSRGILSMFTAEQAPPPLIASNIKQRPSRLYCYLYPRIAVYRWADFVTVCSNSTVFPLALQRLATEAYRLKTVNGATSGGSTVLRVRFLDSTAAESVLTSCRKVLTEVHDPKGLAKAVNGWLFCSHEVTRKGFDFSVFDLDYLLQLILADDKNIWLDFVDTSKLTQEEQQEERLFSLTCHLGPRDPSQHVSDHFLNKPRNSRAIGFPVLPAHRSLPPPPVVDMSALFHVNTVMEMINPLIKHIRTISDDYVVGGENMASEDVKYVELVTKLHTAVMQQVPVQLRCGIRCANPYNTAVQVTTTKFNEATDAQMAQSREKRSAILGELHTGRSARSCRNSIGDNGAHSKCLLISGICAYAASGAIPVMIMVLEGFALCDPLVEAFTPECLSSTELCSAYTRLSEAVRDPERSSRALKLLSKLQFKSSGGLVWIRQLHPYLLNMPLGCSICYTGFRILQPSQTQNSSLHISVLKLVRFVFMVALPKLLAGCGYGLKVRASMLDLVKMLSQRNDWSAVSPERAEELAKVVAVCLPYDSLTNPTDVLVFILVGVLQMWHMAQNLLIYENLRAFSVVARELTVLWSRISDPKFGESLVTTWNAYIDANAESPLVLMSLNTVIGNCFSWAELMEWAQCPGSLTVIVRDYLLSVSSSNKTHPLMLTTAWFLKFLQPSDDVVSALHGFITSIKPKFVHYESSHNNREVFLFRHVWCEASFLLLIWQEVRWLADSVIAAHASSAALDDRLPSFMRWLSKAAKDESSFITNLITSKKTAHSPRLRAILTILELYLMQQMMGESQLPRATENAPVLNSRIHALKEVASVKANQQFAAAFNIATPFFVQVDLHHIGSAPSLVLQCSRALFKEKFLMDPVIFVTTLIPIMTSLEVLWHVNRVLARDTPNWRKGDTSRLWVLVKNLNGVVCGSACRYVRSWLWSFLDQTIHEILMQLLVFRGEPLLKKSKGRTSSLPRNGRHPDKNTAPEAQDRFVAISRAYELLSDPLRKERFDKFGAVDETPQSGAQHHGFGGFEHFVSNAVSSLIGSLSSSASSLVDLVATRTVFLASSESLFVSTLIQFWRGYGIGAVNAMTDGNLLEKLRISRLPAIVAIVEGRVTHYRADMFLMNARDVRVFARDVIPRTYMGLINSHDGLSRFVNQWQQSNKISVVVLGAAPEPRMRYLLAAMKYSHFARFAYIHLSSPSDEVASIRDDLAIKCTQCENVLIFNDLPGGGPVARLSISNINQLTMDTLNNLVENNKWISLPRLSSSEYLDELCPVSSRNPRRLCVILPVMDSSEDEGFLNSFRMFARQHKDLYAQQKVVLTYIYANRQSEWIKPFLEKRAGDSVADARDVLVIWRIEHVKARFTWLESAWGVGAEHFETLLGSVISQVTRLDLTAPVGNLINEYAPSWWTRMCRALVRMVQSAWFHITKEEAYPVLSAVATFLVILVIGYTLNYMNQESRPKKPRTFASDEWHPEDPQSKSDPPQKPNPQARLQRALSIMNPHIHELRAESYFGMIRLLKPGCRSLILLVDEENKEKLLMQFAQYILPLRNNKTFSFGFLMVEKNLPWFRKLLEHTLPLGDENTPKDGNSLYVKLKSINPRQTVGTVLALCGWKLYFSIYHPMHTAGKKKQQNQHFLGFDDDEDITSDSDSDNGTAEDEVMLRRTGSAVSVENVLNGFPNWLDRLLEGSIRRYYIPEWPDNLR
ncbi:DnaJ domain protein [Ostertagia ostertagi]